MKKWNLPFFCLGILLCIGLNYGGMLLADRYTLPFWLDSVGTVVAAYAAGPVCGSIVGVTGNLISTMTKQASPFYALVSIATGVIVGVQAKRKKLDKMLGVMTTSMMLAGAAILIASPLNVLLSGGSTGNVWGDAMRGFLTERGASQWVAMMIGEFYVDFADKLLTLILLWAFIRIERALMNRKRGGQDNGEGPESPEGPEGDAPTPQVTQAVKTAAVLLAVSLGLGYGAARADGAETGIDFNDYVQTVYSSNNGLPCGEANDIAQTNDGILWIGTYAGLYRYNGRNFQWMDSFETVRNVNCLYVDEEGRLWIGTNDNGLAIVINNRVVNVVDQASGLPANSVRSIIRSADGYYYIGTTNSMQILTLNGGLRQQTTLREVNYADHIDADEEGHVAAVTAEGTLFLIRGGQILSSRQMTDGTAFKSCVFDSQGYLMAGTTTDEIHVFDISKGWFEEVRVMKCGGLQSLKDIYFLDSGEMFVTGDNGIGLFDKKGVFELVNTNDFNNSIDKMLMDYQGNLWFTSSRLGLLRMAPSDFRDVYSAAGMPPRVVNTIVFWQDGYYIGTDKGLDVVDETGKKQITNALTEQLDGKRIRCMIVDSRGHLWICTYGSGLVEVEPDGTQHLYNQANGGFGNRARVVTELSDGTILAAGDTGISFIENQQITSTIRYADGKINSMILTVTEMADGRILAGTDGNGIAVIENREVSRMLTRANGLGSEVILRTVRDPVTGGVFVVTSNGLCYMNTDESIRPLNNFPYFNNYDIWIKGLDTLYVMSSAGIYIVNRNELLSGKDEIAYELLDSRRGLNSSLTANSWTWFSENGDLYLACDTGVFVLNTSRLSSGVKSYRMNLNNFRLDGELRRVGQNSYIRVSRGVSKVELIPEIINYSIQDPYVGYYLEGFDSGWTILPHNALTSVVYTNLPAGNYTFHLAVFDNDQQTIFTERTYAVEKEREKYDEPGFLVYVVLIPMICVGWIAWYLFKRRMDRIQKQLAEANEKIEMGRQTVLAIARTVDAKDERTSQHSVRVARYSRMIAEEYGLSEEDCQSVFYAAALHDIGKIGIPDRILNKDSRLTDEEYATMKSHTTKGAAILKDFTLVAHVEEGALYHHERYDGRGYPNGLAGEQIPLFARMIGVADAFDAMTANRVYRKQMDFSYVMGEMERGRGTQFDPQFVDILLKLIHDGKIDMDKIYTVKQEEETPPVSENGGKAGDPA